MRRLLAMLVAASLVAIGLSMPVTAKADKPIREVWVAGPHAAPSEEEPQWDTTALLEELNAWGAAERIHVNYEPWGASENEGWVDPDIAIYPAAGQLLQLAMEGQYLVDLSGLQDRTQLYERFGHYLVDAVTTDGGQVVGAPIHTMLKSLVWYRPDTFAGLEYDVPTTIDELVALADRMQADGYTPWCNAMESADATGWLGTDWIEDLLLGAWGPEVYDRWIGHSVPFADPVLRVQHAFELYQSMTGPGSVYAWEDVTQTPFVENADPLRDGDCLMHRQGFFFRDLPTEVDTSVFATFKFPAVSPAYRDAAMGQAEWAAGLHDRDVVRDVLEYMVGDQFGAQALAGWGWIVPNTGFDLSLYPDELVRSWAGTLRAALVAEQFRPDASDIMPGEVGFGSFLAAIRYMAITPDADIPSILPRIDLTWPME